MREILLALVLVAILSITGAASALSWIQLLVAGFALVIAGHVIGIPAGVVYHVKLRRAARAKGGLPRGWIWRPMSLHDRLDAPDRRRILPWFYVGAAGFALIVLGFVLLGTGMLLGIMRARAR
ncbi:MAG: hypothetical protein PHU25_05995 [Deltaproteobacteria bacterium]|nr:hypothetical protein [Deltaproteobacteria bacterium]